MIAAVNHGIETLSSRAFFGCHLHCCYHPLLRRTLVRLVILLSIAQASFPLPPAMLRRFVKPLHQLTFEWLPSGKFPFISHTYISIVMTRRFLFSLLLLAGFSSGYSQTFDSLLTIQRKADPQEKIYVHFDKNYYNPGETIWFKAYLFTGIEPSEASKNFYAELLDEQGNILSQKTAPVIFSGAAGSFEIDSAFNKRMVYFRAYTASVLNGDTSFLYTKAIRILTSKSSPVKNTTAASAAPTLSFLPEGGDWITGLPSTIAFIATTAQGLPVNIKGTVTDNAGNKLIELNTLHDGMGKFVLTPHEGATYTATWKTEDGKQYTTALPAAKPEGISFKVTDEEGKKRFTIHCTPQATGALRHLHLVGHVNQYTAFEAAVNLTNKLAATGLLPMESLPSGILQITVFDSSYQPVAERITFVNNHNYEFDGDVFLAQKNLAKRGFNALEVTVSDTLPSNLSLSITDADLNEGGTMDDNIISRMLLTGDLRGKIVNPYYYFFSNADSAAIHLDLVMMTHGWRRYNWANVLARKTAAPRLKEGNYLSLSGQITGMPPGSYAPGLQLVGILQTADSAKNFVALPVDRNGKVFTEGLVFYDKAKLFFNFNKKNVSFDKSMLIVNNGLRPAYTKALPDTAAKAGLPELNMATVAANGKTAKLALLASRQMAKSTMMENITVKAKVKTAKDKMEEKYVSGLFSGDAIGFDLVNDPLSSSYMDIFQYLQGKVAGLQINNSGGEPTLSWRGGSPALYLNEMQSDAAMISGTPVSDVAYIKVFRPGSSIVSGGGGGVISIYTRKGGDAQPNPNAKGLTYVQMAGYSPVKQFYSPDYATPSDKDAIDDARTTLYWNPSLYLDKGRRRLRLKFYNNDFTKHFRLVMEGINAEGKVIHVEKVVGAEL